MLKLVQVLYAFIMLGCVSCSQIDPSKPSESPVVEQSPPATHNSARKIVYNGEEVKVFVRLNEPTQVIFSSEVVGGFKKKDAHFSLDRKSEHLIIFPQQGLSTKGEVILVKLIDQRTYSLRITPETSETTRDAVLYLLGSADEKIDNKRQSNKYASSNTVNGLLRELILVSDFGKVRIPGYRESTRHNGETILANGTIKANIERIFIGTSLWGYTLQVENLTSQPVRLNPGDFRLDGFRAIKFKEDELAPRPTSSEVNQQKFKTKAYIVTNVRDKL